MPNYSFVLKDYQLENYPVDFFDYFIDIGACVGEITDSMVHINPEAVVIAYEPCKDNYKKLVEVTEKYKNVEAVNEALGDGRDFFFKDMKRMDRHLFSPEDNSSYYVKSKTLSQIFNYHNIDTSKKCVLKIDCEGGEQYIIGDKESEDTIRVCTHIALEAHFKPYGRLKRNSWFDDLPEFGIYNSWVYDQFQETHDILYWRSNRYDGHGIYILKKK